MKRSLQQIEDDIRRWLPSRVVQGAPNLGASGSKSSDAATGPAAQLEQAYNLVGCGDSRLAFPSLVGTVEL